MIRGIILQVEDSQKMVSHVRCGETCAALQLYVARQAWLSHCELPIWIFAVKDIEKHPCIQAPPGSKLVYKPINPFYYSV